MKRFYLICFDISSDKIRRSVVKLLLAKARRVQKSVFEALISDNHFINLKNSLDELINYDTDSVRYYELCKHCAENVQITGLGRYTEDENTIVV